MSWIYQGSPEGLLATSGNSRVATKIPDGVYEGIVDYVIVDHKYVPAVYAATTAYNIGTIRVRIKNVDHGSDEELLSWADPVDSTFLELPLLGELVVLQKILGNFFYTRKIPVARRLQENALLNTNKELNLRSRVNKKAAITSGEEVTLEKFKLGKYFKSDSRVRTLKHFEGDVLVQGRMGQSIRFGSSQLTNEQTKLAPNIILRTGQGKGLEIENVSSKSVYGLIVEDINKDASSIWMTSDQTVPFVPNIKGIGAFHRSIKAAPGPYDGAQIVLNSDRLVLNSKKNEIILYSAKGINLNSYSEISLDTNDSILLTSNKSINLSAKQSIEYHADGPFAINSMNDILVTAQKRVSIISEKNYIGSTDSEDEPMVGGKSLSYFLARLILCLIGDPKIPSQNTLKPLIPTNVTPGTNATAHVYTMQGPASLSPIIIRNLTALYKELAEKNDGQQNPEAFAGAPFNSGDNYVSMVNEDRTDYIKAQETEFVDGERPVIVENNTWLLKDNYYKIII